MEKQSHFCFLFLFFSFRAVKEVASSCSNGSIGSILRARAMTIIGRLLSKEDVFTFIDESSKPFEQLPKFLMFWEFICFLMFKKLDLNHLQEALIFLGFVVVWIC